MAPPAADSDLRSDSDYSYSYVANKADKSWTKLTAPLKYSGSLDEYESFDVTSVIGKEYPKLQLSSIVNDDTKIRDLAIQVSQRGVVFFRNQDLDVESQKLLGQKLGELTGKPDVSTLNRHPVNNSGRGRTLDENGKLDDEVSVISSEQYRAYYKDPLHFKKKPLASTSWHADITFERVPSDYAILKLVAPPADAGGDTLWASAYEMYDRLSPPFRALAEGLTATHKNVNFNRVAKEQGFELYPGHRGNPENIGNDFEAVHPVVRTNPVTGWKGIFVAGEQIKPGWINGVTDRESEILKDYFLQLITDNHDLQVRFRWNKNDIAIWDNRSVFHTPTFDYSGPRQGNRVVSIGERPFFDPKSVSRREALGI
ncbi:hypothetical protein A1O3_07027 [Capronia epimyces CBS 606.96]|uniref:TauD/TfdA-like domain-containing protein n=1 Tax=Capronia epimyces CBS 606.96 TaxID=1182542 RepID=W9XKJ5_9EURO|nr:uncharacterized protein A1O3_07027 [Capronia epimyces CBS 606.96]EXJ80743.1 hypothetical protein A1O3_07027 [Capronia epimyces CBS 606.96]